MTAEQARTLSYRPLGEYAAVDMKDIHASIRSAAIWGRRSVNLALQGPQLTKRLGLAVGTLRRLGYKIVTGKKPQLATLTVSW